MRGERNLTDADVAAIIKGLKAELVTDFYGEVGRGVWSWIKKAMFGLLLLVAVYGMANHKDIATHISSGTRAQRRRRFGAGLARSNSDPLRAQESGGASNLPPAKRLTQWEVRRSGSSASAERGSAQRTNRRRAGL